MRSPSWVKTSTPLPQVGEPEMLALVPVRGTPSSEMRFEMIALSFQTNQTRVATMRMIKEASMRTFPNVNVDEGSLRFHVAALRKALGDTGKSARYAVNVPGRGYCFVASFA